MNQPKTHAQYIASFSPAIRRKLNEMRALIRKEIPYGTEAIRYGVAAFLLAEKPVVYIAGFKNHVSFFPTSSGVRAFRRELKDYKTSTGTIQFQFDQKVPLALLKRIIRFRLDELGLQQAQGRRCDSEKKRKFDDSALALEFRSLSKPAQRALVGAGLLSLTQVAAQSERRLLELYGVGPSSLLKIYKVLHKQGMKLKN